MAVHLTLKEKNKIIKYKEKNTKASYSSLKLLFDIKFKKNIGQSTFRNIFRDKEKISSDFLISANKNAKRITTGQHAELEEALKLWMDIQEARNNPVTDDLIRTKAEDFARQLEIKDFKLSNRTLTRFKNRMGVKAYNSAGEMASVNFESIDAFAASFRIILKKYDKRDVFNMNEIGLFYRLIPTKSICKKPLKGFKKILSRITIAFTVSMCGEKLKPLVIGNSAKPRALNQWSATFYKILKISSLVYISDTP